jgi:hypothetical protein
MIGSTPFACGSSSWNRRARAARASGSSNSYGIRARGELSAYCNGPAVGVDGCLGYYLEGTSMHVVRKQISEAIEELEKNVN